MCLRLTGAFAPLNGLRYLGQLTVKRAADRDDRWIQKETDNFDSVTIHSNLVLIHSIVVYKFDRGNLMAAVKQGLPILSCCSSR
jgi:hypothetical protein